MHLAKKLVLAVATLGLAAGSAVAADPTGTWQTTTGESRYVVSYCGDGTQLCAKLTWLRSDARTAENLPYLNRYVVKGATPLADDVWSGVVTYSGETFSGKVTMTAADQLKVSGCKAIFCQSMQLTRV